MPIHMVRRRAPGPSLALGGLLLGLLLLTSTAAGAQRPAPATDIIEQQAAARVADAVCGKRVVVLGELPEHGEGRGMEIKARVVERLVQRCGFRAVLVESGSYDFFGFERAIAATSRGAKGRAAADSDAGSDSLELALARAIGGLWWTRELAGWRRWLVREALAGRVVVGGIDDQPSATSAYARATLPGLVGAALPATRANECAEAVARYLGYRYTAEQPYDDTERARLADCSRLAADHAPGAQISAARTGARRTPDGVMLHDAASFFAREKATAERGSAGAPDRDLVMAGHVAWWSARLPHDAKIVVWTATTHATRAGGAQPVRPFGVPSLGARLAERWGDQLAVVGFTALQGEWSRAGHPSQPLAPLPPDALESRALGAGAAGATAAWTYLDRAALRSLGPVPSRLFGKVVTTDWSTAFDGVVVVREEAAPSFETRR